MGIKVGPDGSRVFSSYPLVVPAVVGSGLSLLSLAQMPYGYYQFSRFGVTAMAIWALVTCLNRHRSGWSVAFGAVTVLYNPVIPVHMDRESWVLFNLLGGVLFIVIGCLVNDEVEIASLVSAPVEEVPVCVPIARRGEAVNLESPIPNRSISRQASQTSQISVPAWCYFESGPIAGSLTLMATALHFAPADAAGERGQPLSSWPVQLSDVIAARISYPIGETISTASTIYTTYSTDAFFHLVLRAPAGQIEFALGAGTNLAGTDALINETVRVLENLRQGESIRPLL